MIVPVSSRSGSNYGFVAAHWPPRRYQANRVLLSHANSPATAVIASGRGLTSNTSWLVFSRVVGVSPLSLALLPLLPPLHPPPFLPLVTRHWSSCRGLLFLHFLRRSSSSRRCSVSLSLSQFRRMVAPSNVPRVCARASMSERYPHPVGLSCLPLSAHTPVATENQLVMLASFSARRKTAIC